MLKRIWASLFVLVLIFGIIVSTISGQGDSVIVPHPDQLTYPSLKYNPPHAADYRYVLSNGVVVFLFKDDTLPLVDVSVFIRAGSYLDPAGKTGLASTVSSLIRSGGTARRNAQDFDEEVDFLAAVLRSGGGLSSSEVSLNVLSKDLEKGLDLLFEMLRMPVFQKDRVDLRRSRILQNLERRNDDARSIEAREWARLMRGVKHHASAQPTESTINSITREDLIAFHERYYVPINFILAVSGNFDVSEIKKMLSVRFDGWEPGERSAAVPEPEHSPNPGVYFVNKADVNQGRVSIGHLGIKMGNPDEIAIDLMNDVLGGAGFTSRIMSRVRSDEGLAYSAGSRFSAGAYYPGTFRVRFQSKSRTCAKASRIVLDEIARMRSEKITEEELETVKNNQIGVFPRFFSSARAVSETFAVDELTGRNPNYWSNFRNRVRAVSTDDILRVARQYLQPEKLVILVVGEMDEILSGNPDEPEYSFRKQSSKGKVQRIALPDPSTLVYPSLD